MLTSVCIYTIRLQRHKLHPACPATRLETCHIALYVLCSQRLRVVEADAAAHIAQLAAQSPGAVDLAVVDVFDGEDATPAAVSSPGAAAAAALLRPFASAAPAMNALHPTLCC